LKERRIDTQKEFELLVKSKDLKIKSLDKAVFPRLRFQYDRTFERKEVPINNATKKSSNYHSQFEIGLRKLIVFGTCIDKADNVYSFAMTLNL
jgi:hypothetical protein